MEQLEELGLLPYTDVFKLNAEDDDDDQKQTVLISITVPDKILNQMAEEMQVETTLTYSFTHIFVKAPFKTAMDCCFNKFDADEKLTVIEEYLGK